MLTQTIRRLLALVFAALIATIPLAGRTAEPFEIHAILALTGSAAFLGKQQATALGVIEDLVNKSGGIKGRPIKFVISDDQSDPRLGVQLMNEVISKQVSVVIGSSIVSICNAMMPLAKAGPAVYCLSPGVHPPDGSFVFSASLSTNDLFAASALYFRGRGWRRIAIITSSDATGQDAERGIDAAFDAQSGIQIIDREHFNTTDISVAAQVAHIKASGAQALIAWSTGTPVATILRGLVDAGVDLPVVTTAGNLTYAQMKAYASFLPKEIYFPTVVAFAPEQLPNGPVKRKINEYLNAFKSVGMRPDVGYETPWDPTLLVIDAYKKLGLSATAEQIREYLSTLRGWVGINGQYDFQTVPQRGIGVNNVMLVRWDPTKDTWVGVSSPGGEPRK